MPASSHARAAFSCSSVCNCTEYTLYLQGFGENIRLVALFHIYWHLFVQVPIVRFWGGQSTGQAGNDDKSAHLATVSNETRLEFPGLYTRYLYARLSIDTDIDHLFLCERICMLSCMCEYNITGINGKHILIDKLTSEYLIISVFMKSMTFRKWAQVHIIRIFNSNVSRKGKFTLSKDISLGRENMFYKPFRYVFGFPNKLFWAGLIELV